MSRCILALLVAAVLVTSLCGCEKFTRQRYETVYLGMPQEEVVAAIGEPRVKFSDTWSYIHEEPFYKAIIQIKEGRVTDKQWYDEKEMGTHPDTNKPEGPNSNMPKISVESHEIVQ